VNGEVSALRNGRDLAGPESCAPAHKKGAPGALQKKYFSTPPKTRFFALFENREKTPVSINKDGRFVKRIFLVFAPKQVKNRPKKISRQTYRRLQIWKFFCYSGSRIKLKSKNEDEDGNGVLECGSDGTGKCPMWPCAA